MAGITQEPKPVSPLLGKLADRLNQLVWRVSGGRVGQQLGKYSLLLLTTTGRKSGKERTHVLAYFPDGANLVLVASNGGQAHHPSWYFNIERNPQVRVEMKGKRQTMQARVASDEERARLWPQISKVAPQYSVYQVATRGLREIPLVILSKGE